LLELKSAIFIDQITTKAKSDFHQKEINMEPAIPTSTRNTKLLAQAIEISDI
jgi:hypothetical protein